MSTWLTPVRETLAIAPKPVTFFFRDDDAGWANERLFTLLDLFVCYGLPIDLAVIPQAITPRFTQELQRRMLTTPAPIGIHQHGFAHVNHETVGRKCEFGPARAPASQQQDLTSGQRRLRDLFGAQVQPIFTPPWNRCGTITGQCLVELGFRVLSRDCTAGSLAIPELYELPVNVDWFAQRKGQRVRRDQVGQLLAEAARRPEPVGIMLHHALMDSNEFRALEELLQLLSQHPSVHCQPMESLRNNDEDDHVQ